MSSRVVSYLDRMLEAVQGALEGLNKQAFMTELVKLENTLYAKAFIDEPPFLGRQF
jgi:hypothetical protein